MKVFFFVYGKILNNSKSNDLFIHQLVLELDSIMPEFLLKRYARSFINLSPKEEEDTFGSKINSMGSLVKGYFAKTEKVNILYSFLLGAASS